MIINKKEVGLRLKSFLKKKFGTINEGAKFLNTTASSISNSYLNGKSLPGAEIIAKLIEVDCDINWLLTGEERFSEGGIIPEIKEDNFIKSFGRDLNVGLRIKKIREKQKLNKTQLASLMDMSNTAEIDMLENVGILPSLERLLKLCRSLNVSLDWLLTGEDNPFINIKSDNLSFLEKQVIKKLHKIPDMLDFINKILDGELAKREALINLEKDKTNNQKFKRKKK